MSSPSPTVSVVIPTCQRPGLVPRAVRSVLAQTMPDLEVVVVVDGPDPDTVAALEAIRDDRLQVTVRPERGGPSRALNAGIRAARGEWIGILADDDEWFPRKLEMQWRTARQSPHPLPVICSRVLVRSDEAEFILPRRSIRPGEDVSEYLFCRRGLFWGEGYAPPSAWLVRRSLFLEIPWDEALSHHEDYAWLLRAARRPGVALEFVPEPDPLVCCHQGSNRPRLSADADWRRSLDWGRKDRHFFTPPAYAAFVMRYVGAQAVDNERRSAFGPLLREALKFGEPSIVDFVAMAGIFLIGPTRRANWVTTISRGREKRSGGRG